MMSGDQTVSLKDTALPRFLAAILFCLAIFMGLPTAAVALVSVFTGDWRVILLMAVVWPIVWATVWLARILWTGRSIPPYFIVLLAGLIFAIPMVGFLMKGILSAALLWLVFFSPLLLVFWSGQPHSLKKPAKPKAFDDFA